MDANLYEILALHIPVISHIVGKGGGFSRTMGKNLCGLIVQSKRFAKLARKHRLRSKKVGKL